MGKENVAYGIKKETIVPFVTTWIYFKGIMLNEVKSDRERQMLYDLTYMWNVKTNKQTKARRYTEQIVSCQRQGVGVKWVKGVKRYKLLVII